MPELAKVDHTKSPPQLDVAREFNAAFDLIERNLQADRGDKLAFVDDDRSLTYAELSRRVGLFAERLRQAGVRAEERVLICMLDTIDWPVAFLGAIRAGIVPIAINTLLTRDDYAYMLTDSRARLAFVSQPLMPLFEGLELMAPCLEQLVPVAVSPDKNNEDTWFDFSGTETATMDYAPTAADEPCFWLYSSGSTGRPKGTVHAHSSLIATAELYARPVLGIRSDDVVFSAAKLFFAYGLGNGLTFPMAVGATAVLMPERPTPDAVFARLTGEHKPTIFYGVPTLFAAMLASDHFPEKTAHALRVCTSAGEALPEEVGSRFGERTGVEILDGIGSTEMLHIFLSNRPGRVRYGTTGEPVPGYEVRLCDENGHPVADGEIGDLIIKGPSSALFYWNQRAKSQATFQGEWTKSGDKYVCSPDGYYTYAGRSDDMLKVGGQYVSPFEVESALASHQDVLEAAVVGRADSEGLIKPQAFVVVHDGVRADEDLSDALKQHVKDRLAKFKYPRWIDFVSELPKTATGKIQRFKLRA